MSRECQWQRCRRRATQLSRWPNGVTAWHCDDHAEGVRWSLAHPDEGPDLSPEQRAGVYAAISRFNAQMQKRVDKGGINRVTVQWGDNPEIVVAERRPK